MSLPEEPKRNTRIPRMFATFLRAMALIMFGAQSLLAGFQLGRANESDAFINAVLALFWLGFAVISHFEAVSDAKWKATSFYFERTIETLKALSDADDARKKKREFEAEQTRIQEEARAKAAEEEQHRHDHDMFEAVLKDLGLTDKKINKKDVVRVQKAFHENTDRYVVMEQDEAGLWGVRFEAEPADGDILIKDLLEKARKAGYELDIKFEPKRAAAKRPVRRARKSPVGKAETPVGTPKKAKSEAVDKETPTPKSDPAAPLPGQTELPINKEAPKAPKE